MVCVICFKIIGTCSLLLCLHVDQPASSCEEGGRQVMQNTENFFILCFVCSQLGAVHGKTSPWLESNVMSPWGIGCCTRVSFKNKLSFSRFYIHYNWPLQKIKVWVFTALACWQVVWKRGGQRIFRDQASYRVDNKTGSKGKAVHVHEMKARCGFQPRRDHEGMALVDLPFWRNPVTFNRRLGGPQGLSGLV